MTGKPTETADLNAWELIESGPTAREPAWDNLVHLHVGANQCVETLAVGPEPVPGA